ncbi:lytic transglycosylase domain-containing protein [Gemmobacter sp. 24YEA27]|uniref:lytic transglycosylase domain-containing protein n=1 Tax=Gemmobacter sp. 24YEA27 TaxID=3040672 RepID=UPI0024B381B0|nr:lytic transglycosylase domain-containing protein [Gemmobacter sp. 24YEA27]
MIMSCIRQATGRCGARRRILLCFLSSLLTATTAIPQGLAQTDPPHPAIVAHPQGAHIAEAAQRFDIPAAWIIAVMRVESAGDPGALSSAGAMGLMQVMPATWAELRIRHGLGTDPYDARDNILAGAAYLREMWDRYGNVAAMLAAYNAGPGRYDEYLSAARPLPAETRSYVAVLTPILLGEDPLGGGSAGALPRDWREAAIFAAQHIGTSAADPDGPDRMPDHASSLLPAAPQALTALRAEGLFVQRAADGPQP